MTPRFEREPINFSSSSCYGNVEWLCGKSVEELFFFFFKYSVLNKLGKLHISHNTLENFPKPFLGGAGGGGEGGERCVFWEMCK